MNPPDTPDPFIILPNAIYPVSWLCDWRGGVIELPTLLDRTGLRSKRKFLDAILGSELLEVLARVEPELESDLRLGHALDAIRYSKRRLERVAIAPSDFRVNPAVARMTSKRFEA